MKLPNVLPPAPRSSSPFWWFWERFTDFHTAVYKATHGRLGGSAYGVPVVLIESVGRKSGNRRTHPLLCKEDGDNLVLIASVGGAPKNPAWYWNLQGQEAQVEVGRERSRVRARDAEGEERERLWAQMVALYPPDADYQRKTTRRIPVVVLEPSGRA